MSRLAYGWIYRGAPRANTQPRRREQQAAAAEGSGSDSDESSDESESEEEEEGGIDIDELLQKDDDVFEVENKRSCSNGGMRRGAGGSSL